MEIFEGIKLDHDEIQKRIALKCDELKQLLLRKNEEYGDASFKSGIVFNFARLFDKVSRYQTMMKRLSEGQQPKFESISDTAFDIAGYGIIGTIILDEKEKEGKK